MGFIIALPDSHYSIAEDNVQWGMNVKFGDFVKLKSGTVIGDNCDLADYVCTTGKCKIGNNVNIRTKATISKCVTIEDNVFIGPGVMTNHTKHVGSGETHETVIGKNCIIGSMVEILAGVKIAPNIIVGAGSVVTKDLTKEGVYFGNPCTFRYELPAK